MTKKAIILFCVLVLHAIVTFAQDTITLRNGDRISGQILGSSPESISFKTEFLGEIKVSWAGVEAAASSQELYVAASDGQVILGHVSVSGDQIEIRTQSVAIQVPRTNLDAIRTPAAQEEFERRRNPGLRDLWGGHVDAGLSLARGNSETSLLTVSALATRTTVQDKITVNGGSLFSSDKGETTANAVRGSLRYDRNLGARLFAFGLLDLEFDEFQDLDLRNVLGGGLGWKLLQSDRLSLDVFGGATFNQEFFSNDITRRSGEGLIGEEISFAITSSLSLTQSFSFYPNLSELDEYRMQFDAALVTSINDWLSWNIRASDRFLSNPVDGNEKNDLVVAAGVRLNFGQQ